MEVDAKVMGTQRHSTAETRDHQRSANIVFRSTHHLLFLEVVVLKAVQCGQEISTIGWHRDMRATMFRLMKETR
jgi:hypothetical protein